MIIAGRYRICGNKQFPLFPSRLWKKLHTHSGPAGCLPLQAIRYRLTDDALLTERCSPAALWNICRMDAMKDFAGPAFVDHLNVLGAQLGGGDIHIHDSNIAIDNKCG